MRTHLRLRGTHALVAALVCAAALAGCGDGGGGRSATTKPATTTTPGTSTPGGTAPSSTTATESTAEAVWPWASSTTRYADPVEAARGFATGLIGFADPVMGEYRAGDARSGEVDVRAKVGAAPSIVLVRLIGTSWWVLGATTTDIQVRAPAAGASVSSPLALAGTSTAFEATVNVRLVADGAAPAPASGDSGAALANGPRATLATTTVMGGSMGEMGPFSGSLTFTPPGSGTSGTLVFVTLSAEDGRVLIVTALRVHF